MSTPFATILLAFTLIIFGCSKNKQVNIPTDVFDEERMTTLMVDLQIADAAYQSGMLPPEYDGRPDLMMVDFCKAHETDTASFSKSLKFYTRHPELMEKMYSEVERRLQTMQPVPPKP